MAINTFARKEIKFLLNMDQYHGLMEVISEYMNPELSTLCQPMEKIGKEAGKLLIDIIEENKTNKHIILKTSLRKGETLK